jgi:hypothetical protein
MRVLNLSGVRITGYELVFDLSQLPDIVVTDGTTPKNYINFISHHFPTVHIGNIEIPTVDYTVKSEEELIDFLERYARMGIRQRLSQLYNITYKVKENERVPFVVYYGYTSYLYERLKKILLHPLKSWVVIFGNVGVGKLSLVRSILGNNYLDIFNISERHRMGFRVGESPEEINDVVINVNLLQGPRELKQIMDFLYSRDYQAIFLVEGTKIPEMLNTIPSFYVPNLTERTVKERLLILEHMLRKLAGEIRRNVEVEEGFLRVYFNYPWPKNLSELENALKFALSLDEGTLRAQNLPDHIKRLSGIE